MEGLEHALAEDDPAKANEQSEILKKLLMEETEPKTYGENLPGEAEIYEPQERELTSITEAKPEKEEPQTLTKAELSELLVTEGDTELNNELKGKAKELATPLAVYHFLKNNIGYEYYYGSRKGAAGTYSALAGNDLDQASLLIAMLRYLGCEAEYVRGSIYLTEEQAVALTGADDIIHASNILAAAGTPVVRLIQNGRVEKISIEHVWVRAHIPYTDYRGAGNIVANPETGAGEYMICGGLNGGALTVVLTIAVLCACFASVIATAMLIGAVIAFMGAALTSLAFFIAAEILLALLMVTKGATNIEIIDSSSRPNSNIDKLLSGFEEWLRRQ